MGNDIQSQVPPTPKYPLPWRIEVSGWDVAGRELCEVFAKDGGLVAATMFRRDAEILVSASEMLKALKKVRYELAALVANPSDPDWMPALKNGKKVDAECLQNAWDAAVDVLDGLKAKGGA